MTANEISIEVHEDLRVSGLCNRPSGAKACLLLAHGAGVGMRHASMASLADGLSERGIATLRYQFPYMEQGGRRPDPPSLCHATVRAAVAAAHALLPGLALFAGGRSFGGRMTSQAQARDALGGVKGLVFFAFPLHPAGKPGSERAAHLSTVELPMLFLQGTRDALAEVALLEPMISSLSPRAAVHWLEGADHSFHVPARSGRKDADVRDEMLDAAAAWIRSMR
jgi:predicted alpha/beta-hydrolase family hydrolase